MTRGASPLEHIQQLMPGSHKIEDIFWRLNEDPATAQQRSLLSVETKNAWARTCRNICETMALISATLREHGVPDTIELKTSTANNEVDATARRMFLELVRDVGSTDAALLAMSMVPPCMRRIPMTRVALLRFTITAARDGKLQYQASPAHTIWVKMVTEMFHTLRLHCFHNVRPPTTVPRGGMHHLSTDVT